MAPSPTGLLHIGTARTALFNFLFARHHGGQFLLRIEDTDATRNKKEYEDDILEQLEWLGLSYDALYRQSERTALYRTELGRLISSGKAYISKEKSKEDPSRNVEVVRLRNPGTTITFTDIIHGDISFDTIELGEFIIARSVTDPLYHLAVVIDDAHMNITHIIRGEDHISNTPRQILIQEALGFDRPIYAHIPLILAPDRSKLSKRKGSASVRDYRNKGYLPEAIVNHLALLGWNPGTDQELFSREELISAFELSKIHAAGAIFNIEKLDWFNREYLRRVPLETLLLEAKTRLPEAIKVLPQYSVERLKRALPHIKERIVRLEEITELAEGGELRYYFEAPVYEASLLSYKGATPLGDIREYLTTVFDALGNIEEDQFGAETIKAALWDYATEVGRGAVLWPMRYALSGKEKSPDPFTLAEVLGKTETLSRLAESLTRIESNL